MLKNISFIKSINHVNNINIDSQQIVFVLNKTERKKFINRYLQDAPEWYLEKTKHNNQFYKSPFHKNSVFFIFLENPKNRKDHSGLLKVSSYKSARDLLGSLASSLSPKLPIQVVTGAISDDQITAVGCAFEMGLYNYCNPASDLDISFTSFNGKMNKTYQSLLQKGLKVAEGTNIARYLVDTPSSEKLPPLYAEYIKQHFKGRKNIKVTIWDEKKLKKENCNLILAVGGASAGKPRLVHIQYTPEIGKNKKALAFVGKGITFDTGGVNIKSAAGMRYMKKDMGGSATLLGLAHSIDQLGLKRPVDIYLSMAENAVGSASFRPGDIITSRSGIKVEIDNTDAEGRLVLADALDVAIEKKPEMIVDVATLTGAIKVGLGPTTAGLFSNNDKIANALLKSSVEKGERLWRMPIADELRPKLKSHFADIVNSASGFGGAITAAIFLEHFVKDTPWAHFDIYAWNDSANGPYQHAGGNGQFVQTLINFIETYK